MENIDIVDRFMWAFNKSPSYEQYRLLGGTVPKRVTNQAKWYNNLLSSNGYDKPTKSNVYRVFFDNRGLIFIGTVSQICRRYGFTESQVDHAHSRGCVIEGCITIKKINIDEEMMNIKNKDLFKMKIYKY